MTQIPNYIELPETLESEPERYLLFVGRITPKKAIENLIKSLSLSERFRDSDLVLKIAGRGPDDYIGQLSHLAERSGLDGRVEFIGQIEGVEKQKLYASALWTIMPSHTENFGMVVLESLAQNTPVVASTGSPWKTLEDEKVGVWSDNSPEILARVIDRILSMPADDYQGYRDRSRDFVQKRFDVRMNISRWEQFYKGL